PRRRRGERAALAPPWPRLDPWRRGDHLPTPGATGGASSAWATMRGGRVVGIGPLAEARTAHRRTPVDAGLARAHRPRGLRAQIPWRPRAPRGGGGADQAGAARVRPTAP